MGWPHASRPEARLQPAFTPFAPANRPPTFGLPSRLLRGGRPLVPVAGRGRWAPSAGCFQRGDLWRLQPYSDLRQDTHGVLQFPPFQFFAELGAISVAGIAQHHSIRQAPLSDLIDDFQRQFPLLAKDDFLRNARLAPPLGVVGPTLRQIQPPSQRYISLFANMMNADCDLAVARLSYRARVLPLHRYRVRALFGEPGIIDHPGRI